MKERISRTQLYLHNAKLVALRGKCLRAKVGVVITQGNRVIANGYNGPVNGIYPECGNGLCDISQPCTHSVHAEANAIAFCAKMGIALKGATVYCTHAPCLKCAELMVQAGISEVNYIESYRDNAGLLLLNKLNIRTCQVTIESLENFQS